MRSIGLESKKLTADNALTRLEVSLGDRDWFEDSVKGMKYGALLGLVAGGYGLAVGSTLIAAMIAQAQAS